jgi:hypothetical protein
MASSAVSTVSVVGESILVRSVIYDDVGVVVLYGGGGGGGG